MVCFHSRESENSAIQCLEIFQSIKEMRKGLVLDWDGMHALSHDRQRKICFHGEARELWHRHRAQPLPNLCKLCYCVKKRLNWGFVLAEPGHMVIKLGCMGISTDHDIREVTSHPDVQSKNCCSQLCTSENQNPE